MDAQVKGPDARDWFVDIAELRVRNEDLDARLQGQWRAEGKTAAGSADLRGVMIRGAMPAIHRYLPLTVNPDAREWLATGLPAGEMRSAAITLKGDRTISYGAPGAGRIRHRGRVRRRDRGLCPARPQRKAWPMLENLSGNFRIDKVSLTLDTAGGALMHPAPGQTLSLGAISAVIPNMELNSVLQVTGNSSGSVPAYLALVANSPLGKLLDGALDEAQGTGDWRMPIKLTVPLLNTDDTQVDGHIQFADNSFSFMPEMPLLTQMHGDRSFPRRACRPARSAPSSWADP